MKIKSLKVNGFRCLVDFKIIFEEDLTIIVGENDSGKTSLFDCLKVITQNKIIEEDDFTYGMNEITISIEIDDFIYVKNYQHEQGVAIKSTFIAKPTQAYIDKIKGKLQQEDFDKTDPNNIEFVKSTAKILAIFVKSNSNIDNLISNILKKVNSDPEKKIIIDNASFPKFNNIQLSGRQFENISSFFKEVFLKEKQSNIWHEKVNKKVTIEEFIKAKIESYSNEISEKISEKGVLDKMQLYLKDLTEIKIEPQYSSKDLNIDAKVIFLENGREINIEKKGDGTKRRISMALLEFKKEESLLADDKSTFYMLDEPDTHLHVRAQIDLLETLRVFSSSGDQILLTTHSPFIINSVPPKQIRLLENTDNQASVKYLGNNADSSNKILNALGIENTFLFFSRHLIIVEGETEEEFIPRYYLKKNGRPIASDLIRILNTRGIKNIPGFASAILELHNPENIYMVIDNDASTETEELINRLNISKERKFIVGRKEFEDSFDSSVIYRCWCSYLNECDKRIPENWTIEKIETIKKDCVQNGKKFSKAIKSLNAGGKKMTKPLLGQALGENIEENELPESFLSLLEALG